jgi:ATP-binding cassette subfamily F protein uup
LAAQKAAAKSGAKPAPKAAPVAAPTPVAATPAAKARKLSYKEQRELDGMEASIGVAEGKVAEMEGRLASPDFHKSIGAKAPQFMAELEAARADVARLYARWEELAGG